MASFHLHKPDGQPSSSSSAPSAAQLQQERSGTGSMIFAGQRCHHTDCNREDFLPFKCADCKEHFCVDHFRPSAHTCPAASSEVSYRVPLCPLCSQPPKGWRRDELPDIAMDRHLSATGADGCPALDPSGTGLLREPHSDANDGKGGATRVKRANECNYVKCRKIMVVPIRCEACADAFCPSHRAPSQHACSGKVNAGRSTPLSSSSSSSAAASSTTTPGSRAAAAALARLKAATTTKSSTLASSTTSSSSSSSNAKIVNGNNGAPTRSAQPPLPKPQGATASASSTQHQKQRQSLTHEAQSTTSLSSSIPFLKTKTERCVPRSPSSSAIIRGSCGGGGGGLGSGTFAPPPTFPRA